MTTNHSDQIITTEPTPHEGNYTSVPISISEHISNKACTVIPITTTEKIIKNEYREMADEITAPLINDYSGKGDGITGPTLQDDCTAFMNEITEPTLNNGTLHLRI